jgi:hypothetical protein
MDATTLAARLDLELSAIGLCHACLSFVSMALDSGDERAVAREIRRMAPDLWAEGLALPARAALERARKRGDPAAEAAIADVDRLGARSVVVKAIVRRLAEDQRRLVHEQLARAFPAAPVLPIRPPP